jgi:integrase
VLGAKGRGLVRRGKKPQSRPYFDKADYDKLVHSLRPFAGTGHSQVTKDLRTLLWDYVLILGNTGMRTGREALSLKWLNIRRVQVPGEFDTSGKPVLALQFSVTGKTGSRDLIARDVNDNVTKPLQRIQSRFPALAGVAEPLLFQVDELVFRLPDGNAPEHERLVVNFKKLLEKNALRLDAHGNKRTLYSLRHTYATLALLNGMSMETLAVQMGTSITMIERHYSKLKPQMHAHALSGGAVKQRNAAKKLQGADAKTLADLQSEVERLAKENEQLRQLAK